MPMRLQKFLNHNVVGKVGPVGYSDLPFIVILTNEKVQKNHSFATFLLNDSILPLSILSFPNYSRSSLAINNEYIYTPQELRNTKIFLKITTSDFESDIHLTIPSGYYKD